jgi:ADP-ribose pyrophosphatase
MKADYPHLHEQQLESTQVFRGRLLDVRLDRVRLPDGEECQREYVRHQGAVAVIAQLDNGQLLLVRQHRYPLRRALFSSCRPEKSTPARPSSTPPRGNCVEETGYSAADWRHLGVMHPCVGYSDERIEIFLARGVRREAEQNLDSGEFMDVLSLSLEDVLAAIKCGEITDAKTITGLFWAEKAILAGW